MPTVLLQEIRDLLIAFLTGLTSKIEAILEKLGLIEEDIEGIGVDVSDIKTSSANTAINTGAMVTPVVGIKSDTTIITSKINDMQADLDAIERYMSTISSNTGAAAGFAEDCATNTLDIYDKIVTIASDTTQMRSDNQIIIDLLQQLVQNTTPTP